MPKSSEDAALLPRSEPGQKLIAIFGTYLWETLESPNTVPARWRTLQHQLRPREGWQDVERILGVRFAHTTKYGMFDIDAGGRYCNPESLTNICAALETIGIVRTVTLRSSQRGGIHLYVPLASAVATFDLACALEECLKAQGFELEKGHLEVFPNPKTYGVNKFIEYNGHRLPLQPQTGSYLLNEDLQPTSDRLDDFFVQWDWAAAGQDMELLRTALPHAREARKQEGSRRVLSRRAEEWKADLDIEIDEGWSGPGQTNRLLKAISTRGHVFEGLKGESLERYITETARATPGFEIYCQHQHQLQQRSRQWARAIENYYWPYGSRSKPQPPPGGDNTLKQLDARQRIAQAFEALQNGGIVFPSIRSLAHRLAEVAHSSLQSLYKHADLWHPEQRPEKASVTALSESLSADQTLGDLPPSDPPMPCESEVLHTQGGDMKCIPLGEVRFASKITPERGVRGDEPSFPQVRGAISAAPAEKGLESIAPTLSVDECYSLIQRSVQRLQWTLDELRPFIAEKFAGRTSISQLKDNEFWLLAYFLQDKSLSLENSYA